MYFLKFFWWLSEGDRDWWFWEFKRTPKKEHAEIRFHKHAASLGVLSPLRWGPPASIHCMQTPGLATLKCMFAAEKQSLGKGKRLFQCKISKIRYRYLCALVAIRWVHCGIFVGDSLKTPNDCQLDEKDENTAGTKAPCSSYLFPMGLRNRTIHKANVKAKGNPGPLCPVGQAEISPSLAA